jgi:hypothetical protein
MKRIAVIVCAVLGLVLSSGRADAGWGHLTYQGYDATLAAVDLVVSYKIGPAAVPAPAVAALAAINWVAYYNSHPYEITCGPGGCGRIQFSPVFVSPTMQWAVPQAPMNGPSMPGGCPPPY